MRDFGQDVSLGGAAKSLWQADADSLVVEGSPVPEQKPVTPEIGQLKKVYNGIYIYTSIYRMCNVLLGGPGMQKKATKKRDGSWYIRVRAD